MFGMMFGDFCHGLVLLTLAIYLCIYGEKVVKEKGMFAALVPSRYLLLFMGTFAAYCGFIYNDFASLPLNAFTSCYSNDLNKGVAV